ATDCAGCRAIVEDGKTGFLLPTGSTQEIVKCIAALAANRELAAEMGRNATEAVRRRGFDEADVQLSFARIYRMALETRSHGMRGV
nr:hypothetical protein [Rhizobiaceae bacterium]